MYNFPNDKGRAIVSGDSSEFQEYGTKFPGVKINDISGRETNVSKSENMAEQPIPEADFDPN